MNKILYHPSGRAGEYANKGYALNLFGGCKTGCRYCYCPSVLHMTREAFHAKCEPTKDVLTRLEADMKRVGVLDEPIFLCFTTDPYGPDAPEGITREAIKIIFGADNRVNILTKAGMKATIDFDLLSESPGNKVGSTLTFRDYGLSLSWEPRAAWPMSRVTMLRLAHEMGIQTWASIEPVILPDESLAIMEAAIPFVDEFKIGRWNHDKRANDIDWPDFVRRAEALMVKHGKRFMFKKELRQCQA